VPEPQVEYSAAGPVHDERQQDDGQYYHDHPDEEHDDAGEGVPRYSSRFSHGRQLPTAARLIRRDRHRHARPCAVPLLRRPEVQPGRVRPRIRYCSTPAGRVAYSTAGAGPALLCDSGWITDLRGQLELYSFGSFIERLAERFTVIRYDKPGCGLSDRDGIDLSTSGRCSRRSGRARQFCTARRTGAPGSSWGGRLLAPA
jgi:hypothetical protein